MANYNSKITIGTNIDTSKLDGQLSEIQRKLKNLRETGPGGSYSQLAQQYRSEGNEKKAKQIEELRDLTKNRSAKELNNTLKEQESSLEKLTRHYNNIQVGLRSLAQGTEEWNKKNEQSKSVLSDMENTIKRIGTLKTGIPALGGGVGGGGVGGVGGGGVGGVGGGGVGGPPGVGGGGRGPLADMIANLSLAKVLGIAGTGVAAAGNFYKAVQTYPERITQREADVARMESEAARLQAQGKGYEMALFAPERARAMEKAKTRVGAEKVSDVTGLGSTVLGGAALGAGIAHKFAAPLLAAPMGVGLPLYAGAVGLAALGGGATAFGSAMFSDRKRSMLFDQEAYQKEMASIYAGTYKKQFQAEREKNYEKDLAAQFLGSQGAGFLETQRRFGLSDQDLFLGEGSILRRAAREGYGIDTMTGAMRGISAAGGTTRTAVEGSQIAAELQRNLDLTNAPQLMGKLTGATGMSAIQSKDEMIRMYAEGTKIGLDSSEVREYMQAAADIQYKSGGDLDSIKDLLGMGIQGTGLESTRGIEAAQNALSLVKQQTSSLGGMEAQYRMADFMSKEFTDILGGKKGVTSGELAVLTGTDPTKLTDDYLRSMLEERGVAQEGIDDKVKELREKINKIQGRSIAAPGSEEIVEKYNEMIENPDKYKEQEKRAIKKQYEESLGMYRGETYLGLGGPEKEAYKGQVAGLFMGRTITPTEEEVSAAKGKAETPSGRLADRKLSSAAMDAAGQLSNLENKSKELADAFDKTVKMGEKAAELYAKMNHLAEIVGEKGSQNVSQGNIDSPSAQRVDVGNYTPPTNYVEK